MTDPLTDPKVPFKVEHVKAACLNILFPPKVDPATLNWGFRINNLDMTSSRNYRWPFPGKWARASGPFTVSGDPCPSSEGDGICIAHTLGGAASGGLLIGRSIGLLLAYHNADVLASNSEKSRAKRVWVAEIFDPIMAILASKAYLSRANLSGADLSRADLFGADLSGANLSRANLSRANLSGANLSGADLSGANLSGAYLFGANLSRANLSGANLFGADLSGANLSGANLFGADLSEAYLFGANLSRAYLSKANLFGADLSGADLSGANLFGANLSGANLFGADLSGAINVPAGVKT
jgi:uncharacterized protein YjbI with pentapeptide repeats